MALHKERLTGKAVHIPKGTDCDSLRHHGDSISLSVAHLTKELAYSANPRHCQGAWVLT